MAFPAEQSAQLRTQAVAKQNPVGNVYYCSEVMVIAKPLKVYWPLFGNTQHNLPWDPMLPIGIKYIRCVAVMV